MQPFYFGILNLGRAEVLLLALVVIVIPVLITAAVLIGVYLSRKKHKHHPSVTAPTPAQSATRKCPQCGTILSATTPEGLCPACLLQRGVATETVTSTRSAEPAFVAPAPVNLANSFPQLEIIGLIGAGGMGAVYKARQPSLDRYVALKILAKDKESNPQFAERFAREAKALARLNHPNIVAVHDSGEAGGHFFLLMEFVDGLNLRELQATQKLAPEEALAIVPKICEALQYAHDQGIVHRDIKPENILIDKHGRVKIADFGIAKIMGASPSSALSPAGGPNPALTQTRQILGTPHYMAPEQVEKPQAVDHRADIFSLGVVFYEMLTGELPLGRFPAPSQKVQVDVRLDSVVLRALEKEPGLRYQQASGMKTDVETITAGPANDVTTRPALPRQSAPPALRAQPSNRWVAPAIIALAGVILIAGIVGIILIGFGLRLWARAQSQQAFRMAQAPVAVDMAPMIGGMQPPPPAMTPAPVRMPLGPTMANLISRADADNQGIAFLQIRSGKVMKAPFSLSLRTGQGSGFLELTTRLQNWIRSNDLDLAVHLGERQWDLMTLEMQTDFVGQPEQWDEITVDNVAAVFAQKDAERLLRDKVPMSSFGHDYTEAWSSCNAFRTRDGLTGVVQWSGAGTTDGSGAIKFRYKNSETEYPAGARAPALALAQPVPVQELEQNVANRRRDLQDRLAAATATSNFVDRDTSLAAIAEDAAKAGETSTARAALAKMSQFVARNEAGRKTALILKDRGMRTDALAVANTISDFVIRDATLGELSK